MNSAILTVMRTLDDIEAWTGRAENVMAQLSGRTPLALRRTFSQWPLVSAPMAETVTGASRAAVQRNLAWMEARGLIREVTGQGRYRMWSLDI
jgi:Fic family protein